MIFFFFTMIFVIGCSDNSTNNPDNTFSDKVFRDERDGKEYGLVKINTQVWMSENLNASTYRNGDSIQHARTSEQWVDAARKGEGAWCYYDHDPRNAIYGKLYNWYAVNDSRGLAPTGYHIPSDTEWTLLTDFLGGESVAGQKMKSTSGWPNGDNGDNSSGFNGLPGGFCSFDGDFKEITLKGFFWSSSDYYDIFNDEGAWQRFLYNDFNGVNRGIFDKNDGLSVRCLRD